MAVNVTGTRVPSPPVSIAIVMAILIAGSVATVVFDLFGQALSPLAGYAKLAPVGLAKGTIKTLFGTVAPGAGDLLHYLIGLVAYPLGWILVARPLSDRLTPWLPKIAVAIAYGIGLWIFALYIMAHWVVGMPAFLGFTGITWVALVGHVVYAVTFLVALDWLERR